MSKRKYIYCLVRFILKFVTKVYPKEGWTCVWRENSKSCASFDMTKCLYLEELEKRGEKDLCKAFCATDVAAYAPLAPAVLFIREGTLAETEERCDFCFKKG